MPKVKARGSAKKRIKISGSGKFMRKHANTSHKFMNKSKKRKRRLSHWTTVKTADLPNIRRALALR